MNQSALKYLVTTIKIAFFYRVALIGGHTVYKIDDTDIIPIANDQDFARMNSPDEAKYRWIFDCIICLHFVSNCLLNR